MSRFEGLTDREWEMVEPLLPPYPWSATNFGKRPMNPRFILNTLIWILTSGARWCDVPRGTQWASKSCAHKHLGIWKETGVLAQVLYLLQQVCMEWKMIDLRRLSVDGFFFRGQGRRRRN